MSRVALMGGGARDYLEMSRILNDLIEIDLLSGLIAVWHDESYLNRWCLDSPIHVLNSGYLFPEDWKIPFHKRVIIRSKEKILTENQLSEKNNKSNMRFNRNKFKKKREKILLSILRILPDWVLRYIYGFDVCAEK